MNARPVQLPRPRLLSTEQLGRICEAGRRILATHGLRVLHSGARESARRAGLRVAGDRVFPEAHEVEAVLAETRAQGAGPSAPEPTEERPLLLTTCQYATHLHDLNTDALVPISTDRLVEACKLIDVLAAEGVVGGAPGAPSEVPYLLQPLMQYKIQAQHCRHGRRPVDPKWAPSLRYVMAMAEALGHPIRSLPVYVVSPLTIGAESLESVLAVVDRLDRIYTDNMPSVGGSAPLRIGDALALGVAECVGSAIVLRAVTGLPVDWSVGAQAFDLRGMAMSFGGPEHQLFRWAAAEMNAFCRGREPGVPGGWAALRTQAKLPGPQAAAEKAMGAATAALLGSRDLDGAGTLSLDEVFSAEQLVMDCEIRDHVGRLVAGVDGDCDPEAAIAEVGLGMDRGFLALDSTLSTYREVYWLPRLFERRSLAGWMGGGSPKLGDRAREMAKEYAGRHEYELPSDLLTELDHIYNTARRELANHD